MLGDRSFQSAVRHFDVAVFVRALYMNGVRLDAEMGEQLQVLGVVTPLRLTRGVRLAPR